MPLLTDKLWKREAMNIIRISERNFSQFNLILTAEAVNRLTPGPDRAQDTFALGMTDGSMPLGAIAVKCSPPTAEVISLYVVEEYRRLGIGAQLLLGAISDAMTLPGISELIVPYSERPGEDVYTSFFNGVEMELIDVGAEYRITVKDALSSQGLSDKFKRRDTTQPWRELLSSEQKILFMEGAGLYDYFVGRKLREDLVFVSMNEERNAYLEYLKRHFPSIPKASSSTASAGFFSPARCITSASRAPTGGGGCASGRSLAATSSQPTCRG